MLDFAKKNNLKKNIFKDFKSILNLKKLNQDIIFIANFGRDVEYYTGIVFEVFSGKKKLLEAVVMMTYLKAWELKTIPRLLVLQST